MGVIIEFFKGPHFKYDLRKFLLFATICCLTIIVSIFYYKEGGSVTNILGGLAVNLFTLAFVIGFIDQYVKSVEEKHKKEIKQYLHELGEKLKK